jgi:hypothetical protein
MHGLRDVESQRKFHQAVEALRNVTENPLSEELYRVREPDGHCGSTRILRFGDELQIADHIAFLAHSEQGVEAISAVCVEERVNGLVFRLASNSTPSEATVSGLKILLEDLSHSVTAGEIP